MRVVAVLPAENASDGSAFVHIGWSDDYGRCHAAGRYPAELLLPIRVPAQEDRQRIHQGIDRASWRRQEVSGAVARLIAAHLHLGPRSALYGFAVNGLVTDRLFDELNQVDTSRAAYRPWVSALARFCLSLDDVGPVPGWGPTRTPDLAARGEHRPQAPTKAAARPLTAKRMSTDTAVRLIESAYALGLAAGQGRHSIRRRIAAAS